MTERIYQLRESEYNELFEKAKLNDKEIKELAEKYYKDRGIFKITIDTSIKLKNEDVCQGSIATFDVNSYCFENEHRTQRYKLLLKVANLFAPFYVTLH